MFFNGLSRTRKAGEIPYLVNENRDANLAFSFQMQLKCQQYYPGLARRIYLKGYRYNMQYRARSLLVELGAQTNTLEEVHNAVPLLADDRKCAGGRKIICFIVKLERGVMLMLEIFLKIIPVLCYTCRRGCKQMKH